MTVRAFVFSGMIIEALASNVYVLVLKVKQMPVA